MPLLLEDLKYNKLYTKKVFLPINEDNRRKGANVFLLTPSYESSIRCMTYPKFLNNRLYESYYAEKDVNFIISRESSEMTLERSVLNELDLVDNSMVKYNRVTIPVEELGSTYKNVPLKIRDNANGTAYVFTDHLNRAMGCIVINGSTLTGIWGASSKLKYDLLDFACDTMSVNFISEEQVDPDIVKKAKKEYGFKSNGKYLMKPIFKDSGSEFNIYGESTVLTESVNMIDAEIKIWEAQIKITETIIKFFDDTNWVAHKLNSMKSKLVKIPIEGYNNSLSSVDDFKAQLNNQKATLSFYTTMKSMDLKEQYDLSDIVDEYTYWVKALKCPKTLKIKILRKTIASYKQTIKEYERTLSMYKKMSIVERRVSNVTALASKVFSIFGFLTSGILAPIKGMVMKSILPKSKKKAVLSDDELEAKIVMYKKIVEVLEEELEETQALQEIRIEEAFIEEVKYSPNTLYVANASDTLDGNKLSEIDEDKYVALGITSAIGFAKGWVTPEKNKTIFIYQPNTIRDGYKKNGNRLQLANDPIMKLVGEVKIFYNYHKGKPIGYEWIWHYDEDGNKVTNWQESTLLEGTTKIPDDIVNFLETLNSYKYGILLKNGKVETDLSKIDFGKQYQTTTVSEFNKYHAGVCWDFVNYEADWFKTNGYEYECYYAQLEAPPEYPTHTFLLFRLPDSHKYYYFESSWIKFKGIYEFNSRDEALHTIYNNLITEYGDAPCYIWKYNPSSKLEHKTATQYMQAIYKGSKPIFNSTDLKESTLLEASNDHLYFYHLAPKGMKGDLYSLQYLYDNKNYLLFDKYTDKYRDRIVNNWGYYHKNPEELTREEIMDALKKFRSEDSLDDIYFFRYSPYSGMGKHMDSILDDKDVYMIDLNDPKVKSQIKDIYWGREGSNADGKKLNRKYYENVSKEDYFSKYDDSSPMNYASLNHISIKFKDGYIPKSMLTKVSSLEEATLLEAASPENTLKKIKGFISYKQIRDNIFLVERIRHYADDNKDHKENWLYILTDDNKIASEMLLYNKNTEMYSIETRKQHRKKGYATKLITCAVNDLGAKFLSIKKSDEDGTAHNLYKKLGFKEYNRDDDYIYLKINTRIHESALLEGKLSSKDRKDLPDSEFGIPSKRKFPLNDESHIKSAIKMFNHVDSSDEAELAKNIKKKAKEFDIEISVSDKNRLSKYLVEYAPILPINEDYQINEYSVRTKEYLTIFESTLLEADSKYNSTIRRMIYEDRIRSQKELLYQYDRVKEDCMFIKKTFLNYDKYMGFNLFVDMSYYMDVFIRHNYLKLDKSIDLTIDFISRFLDDKRLKKAGYNKQTVFVPIHDWKIKEDTDLWDYKYNINPISIIHRMMKRGDINVLKSSWKDIDFIFLGDTGYFKLKISDFDSKALPRFMQNIKILINNEPIVDNDEPDNSPKGLVAAMADKLEVNSGNKIEINNLVGSASDTSMTPKDLDDKISSTSNDVADVELSKEEKKAKKEKELVDGLNSIAKTAADEDDIEEAIDNNEALKQTIVDLKSMNDIDISPTRAARITELNSKFMEKEIKNKKVSELIEDYQNSPLEETPLPVDSINEEWKHITYTSFNNKYNVDADISKCIYHFSDCTIPVAVRDINVVDNSTSEDSIETWTVNLEDAYGKRFTIKFDVPKIVDKRFMKLRGNKKTMTGQLMNLPIIKTDRDTCQITSNYNKIFVRRFNTSTGKSNACAGRYIKACMKAKEDKVKNITVEIGDNTLVNNKYNLPVDYIDIGSVISKVILNTPNGKLTLYFNQDEFLSLYKDKLDSKKGDFAFIVMTDKSGTDSIIYPDASYYTISEFAANMTIIDPTFKEYYKKATPPIKATYAKASIMSTEIPVAVLLGYQLGFTAMLKRANINYEIEDKRPSYDNSHYDSIRLEDCWIVYENTYLSSMIMNGLKECDMANYTLVECNTKRMWMEQLDNFGGRIKADGLDMFNDLMFDPITKEVCAKYKIPDNYCDSLIYASDLLADIKYNKHSDISGNRFRNNEVIAGYVYKVLATSYSSYRRDLKMGRQSTMSVKQSSVIDAILSDNTCSDLSILSPLLEVESANSVGFKGLSGMNTDRAYSLDKRLYSESMVNILGMSSGFSANVGITRQATIDMNIDTNRGYIKPPKEEEMSIAKTFCMTEALTPYGTTSDDTFRTAMTFIQTSKHEMRTAKSDPLLVSNGADQALPYLTSNTFSYKARSNGKIIEKTDDYMVIEYNDKTTEVVDLREKTMKNSDGGMWVPVKLDTKLKEGNLVKAGEIVAIDNTSYSISSGPANEYAYNIGTLVKMAIMASDAGYEDACMHTEYLTEALTSKIIDQKQCVFPKNTNVYEIVKKGQAVSEGDPLIIFQNAFDEDDANDLVRMLTNADDKAISELGRIPIRSSVTGVIDDIKIYRCVETNELSPSLKKIVNDYERETKKFNAVLEKYDVDKAKEADATYKLEPTGKLKNCVDSVMIEFYISYEDNFGTGDKVVNYSALKGVSGRPIPKGLEPVTQFRPEEKIHYIQSDDGAMRRMVGSIFKIGALNKLLIETGRKACDIMGVKWKYLDEY